MDVKNYGFKQSEVKIELSVSILVLKVNFNSFILSNFEIQ